MKQRGEARVWSGEILIDETSEETEAEADMQLQHPSRSGDAVVEPIRTEMWREAARCRGTDPALFFPPDEDGEEVSDAKAVCGECAVREQCLEYALQAGEQFGVWGGTTPRERRRILRVRRKSA